MLTWTRHHRRGPTHLGWVALLLLAGTGCNLPGISTPLPEVEEEPAVALPETAATVCVPSARTCQFPGVMVCSADGTDFSIESCGTGQTCRGGACLAIDSTCDQGQPLSLSSTRLLFDVNEDYKTVTKQLRLDNCGDQPLFIETAEVRGPARGDGTSIFAFREPLANDGDTGGSPAKQKLRPGESIAIDVVFRPAPGFSHVRGTLELGIVADGFDEYVVDLESRVECLTATPTEDLGVVTKGETAVATLLFQNCGTERVRLEGASLDMDEGAGARLDPVVKLPSWVEPSDTIELDVRLEPDTTGVYAGTVHWLVADQLQATRTSLRTAVVEPGCGDLVHVPSVVVDDAVVTTGSTVEATSAVRILHNIVDGSAHFSMAEGPKATANTLERMGADASMTPEVVGRYLVNVQGIAADGLAACTAAELPIDVSPPGTGLYVELTWSTDGDPILDDDGFGRGANLDLHVLSSTDGSGVWNNPDDDCFAGVAAGCGGAGGAFLRESRSGAGPELAHFADPAGMSFEVGVHLANPFGFQAAHPKVRIFDDGVLIDEVDRSLQEANDFWFVGLYDAATGSWTRLDDVHTGVPR